MYASALVAVAREGAAAALLTVLAVHCASP
jgi:hypothetical protein